MGKVFNCLLSAAVVRVRLDYRLRLLQLPIKMGFPEGMTAVVSGEVCVKYQKKVLQAPQGMGTAPNLGELMKHLDNALRHMWDCWGVSAGPGLGLRSLWVPFNSAYSVILGKRRGVHPQMLRACYS